MAKWWIILCNEDKSAVNSWTGSYKHDVIYNTFYIFIFIINVYFTQLFKRKPDTKKSSFLNFWRFIFNWFTLAQGIILLTWSERLHTRIVKFRSITWSDGTNAENFPGWVWSLLYCFKRWLRYLDMHIFALFLADVIWWQITSQH